MRAIRGAWSGDDRRMRGESQAGQNAIRKNAEIVTERDIHIHVRVIKGALSACACACGTSKNEWSKWKNHFYEMKGDVGMSLHEKERNKKMPTPRHKVTHNPIPTSLCLPRPQRNIFRRQLDVKMFCCLLCLMHS